MSTTAWAKQEGAAHATRAGGCTRSGVETGACRASDHLEQVHQATTGIPVTDMRSMVELGGGPGRSGGKECCLASISGAEPSADALVDLSSRERLSARQMADPRPLEELTPQQLKAVKASILTEHFGWSPWAPLPLPAVCSS